ncbi:MAG: sodium:glutamate symporter, partial [bacterium]
AFGFEGAGSVGLTFAAVGFFWAIFGGVLLINLAVRKGWVHRFRNVDLQSIENRSGLYKKHESFPVGAHLTTQSEAIETFSFNLAIILIVYLVAYLFLTLLTFLLGFAGPLGMSLAESFWGISFIFATLFGVIAKRFLHLIKVDHILENGTLTRTAGFSVDFMVAASIGAISVQMVARYWAPILIMGVVSGGLTILLLLWIGSRLLLNYKFERVILIYGALTGTLPSGLTLLRVVDPEFQTPASADYIPAAGIMFIMAIPYILMVDFPAYAFRDNNPFYYWLTAAIFLIYVLFVAVSFLFLTRGRRSRRGGNLWKA